MRTTLSSGMTIFFKCLLPGAWIGLFGFGTGAMFLGGVPVKWVFLGVWVLGSALLYWVCVPLKKVELEGRTLFVSNYLKTVQIDVTEICRISENPIVSIHPVWIHLKNPSLFGAKIMFMPHTQWSPLGMFRSHPIVDELLSVKKEFEKSTPTTD